jgi:Zn-dependent protease with chaperone function
MFRKIALAAFLMIAALPGGADAAVRRGEAAKDQRFVIHVTAEMQRHTNILYALYFIGTAYSIAVLYFILRTGLARRLRDIGRGNTFLTFALLSIVVGIFEYPLTLYAGYIVPHEFDLSDQSFASWTLDLLKGLGLEIVVTGIIATGALLIIRRVRRWWIALWVASIPLMVFLVVIAPVVFDPVFNKFEPLKDPVLRKELLDEAARAGISGSRVFQVDKSKQTKTMNAYVTGIGPTTRIVIWDTLLAKMSREEIVAVMGHEMGHYVLNHIWWGLAEGVVISFIVCFFVQFVYERGLSRWGITRKDDPAALPWILLIATIFGFLLSPLVNGLSRRVEHEADVFGLELTHLNEADAIANVKLSEDSKFAPNPPRFIEFWLYSHPPVEDRIDLALHYKPWERGEPNQLWKPGALTPRRGARRGDY